MKRKHHLTLFIIVLLLSNLAVFFITRNIYRQKNPNLDLMGNGTSPNIEGKGIDSIAKGIQPKPYIIVPYEVKQLFKPKRKPSREYYINMDEPQEIITEKGSGLLFPKGCFVDNNNNPIENGVVKVEIAEINTTEELVEFDIPTISGDDLLISGGCYYLNANYLGKQVKINPDIPVIACLKNHSKIEEMDFYVGEVQGGELINWRLLSENKEQTNNSLDIYAYSKTEYERLNLYLSDNIFNKDIKYVVKAIDVGESEDVEYYVPKGDFLYTEFLDKHKFTYCNDDYKKVSPRTKDIFKDFRFYNAETVESRLKRFEYLKRIKRKMEDFKNRIKDSEKVYELNFFGWYNLDIKYDEPTTIFSGLFPETFKDAVEVHLVSTESLIHLSKVSYYGFEFDFVKNEPFMIIAQTQDGKRLVKEFDGSNPNLGLFEF